MLTLRQGIEKKRETKITCLDLPGLPLFTELLLTPDELTKLEVVKRALIGHKVRLTQDAFNRRDEASVIEDIRIVVTHYGIHPCALLKFPEHYVLRGLDDLINENTIEDLNLKSLEEATKLITEAKEMERLGVPLKGSK